MKYVIATIVCAAEYFLLQFAGAIFLGWEHGGGVIPMLIILAICGATWRMITGRVKSKPIDQNDGKQYLRDILQEKFGGEWKKIKLPSPEYGGGWCELGCGKNIGLLYSCYELKSGDELKGLLCPECWTNARK